MPGTVGHPGETALHRNFPRQGPPSQAGGQVRHQVPQGSTTTEPCLRGEEAFQVDLCDQEGPKVWLPTLRRGSGEEPVYVPNDGLKLGVHGHGSTVRRTHAGS